MTDNPVRYRLKSPLLVIAGKCLNELRLERNTVSAAGKVVAVPTALLMMQR